ncbi:MAG: hypothetical protein ACLTLL_11435 [Acutalibacteraceae bacterium]
MKIELRANAKINLFLDILAKLPNGYHSLFMVMQSVSLADTVTVQENGEGIIRITCSGAGSADRQQEHSLPRGAGFSRRSRAQRQGS